MMIQERELEQLQARIREAEERLKARQSLVLDGNNTRSPSAQRGDRFYQSGENSQLDNICHGRHCC